MMPRATSLPAYLADMQREIETYAREYGLDFFDTIFEVLDYQRMNEVAAYGWVSTGAEWIGELGLEIWPPRGEAYVWNCVTLPAHRLRGYFQALLRHVTRTAREEGVRRIWIGSIDGGAEPAVVGAGFEQVLRFRVASLVGLRWLSVRAADGADPRTVAEALASLGTGRGPLRPGLRRATRRRH